MRDLANNLGAAQALAPQVLSATDTSAAIDLINFNSAMVVINTGAIVGSGNFTARLQESDTTTSGDFTDVASGDLIGALPSALAASSVYRQGYIGHKRYVRLVTTKNSGTSIAAGAVVIKGDATSKPVT
jgi:hypothetical protein